VVGAKATLSSYDGEGLPLLPTSRGPLPRTLRFCTTATGATAEGSSLSTAEQTLDAAEADVVVRRQGGC